MSIHDHVKIISEAYIALLRIPIHHPVRADPAIQACMAKFVNQLAFWAQIEPEQVQAKYERYVETGLFI